MINPHPVFAIRDFDDLRDDLDFLLDNYFPARRAYLMPAERGWRPRTDMFETDTEIVIMVDIAGITTRDFRLQLEANQLILRGIRREYSCEGKRKYYKMEIDFGPFERRIELPAPIDPDGVVARYSQGFLEIRLPKREEGSAFNREITIT